MTSHQTSSSNDFFSVGGALGPTAPSYVQREADDKLFELASNGKYAYVLTPRQMGKTSLIHRTAKRLREEGIVAARVDISPKGSDSDEKWYLAIVADLNRQLRLPTNAETWWHTHESLDVTQRFIEFLRSVVLEEIKGRIVIFVDEIDSTLRLNFSDNFFIAIRYFYNFRDAEPNFERLSFVLLGAASPTDLIRDMTRTPFNIAEGVVLYDFTPDESATLRRGLENALPNQGDYIFRRIYHWTKGHPYLTQKLCSLVVKAEKQQWREADIDRLVEQIFLTESARGEDNLKFVQSQILQEGSKQRLALYRKILKGRRIEDDPHSIIQNQLKLSGLVKVEERRLVVRNPIYKQVFDLEWCRQNDTFDRSRLIAITAVCVALIAVIIMGYVLWNNSVRVPNLATGIESTFLQTADPQQQVRLLVELIKLDQKYLLFSGGSGYSDKAANLFYRLSAERQILLFAQQYDSSPLIVQKLYTSLGDVNLLEIDEPSSNTEDLLTQMALSIENTEIDGSNAKLKSEIEYWVKARHDVRTHKYIQALSNYSQAIEINANNPTTRYERALVRIALEDYQSALGDFELVARNIDILAPNILIEARNVNTATTTSLGSSVITSTSSVTNQSVQGNITVPVLLLDTPTSITTTSTVSEPFAINSLHFTSTITEILTNPTTTTPSLRLTLTPTPIVYKRISPSDLIIDLRLKFAQYPQLIAETDGMVEKYPTLSILGLVSEKFAVKHVEYRSEVQVIDAISSEEDARLDNSSGTTSLQIKIEFERPFQYQINKQLTKAQISDKSLYDKVLELYKLQMNNSEDTEQTAICPVSMTIPAGQKAKVTLQWTERWAEGVITEGSEGDGNLLGSFSIFLGYTEPCDLVNIEFGTSQLEFAIKHLRDEVGDKITESISYSTEAGLDNSGGTAPLQVQIQFERNYRFQIIYRSISNEISSQRVQDKLVEFYRLPPNDPEGKVQTAICPISVVIPAEQKTSVTVEWNERWAEGVINEGHEGEGDRLGTYSIFLGYIEPCSLVNQVNVEGTSVDKEFAVKHLRDEIGEKISQEVSYRNEAGLDNSSGTAPLQVQLQFERNYRFQIILRLQNNEIPSQSVQDRIVEFYKLPPNDPEGELQTALCPVSVVIPAGQKAIVIVEWTERWAEGVINQGKEGEGDRMGTYSVFLGYTEPCSLVNQINE